MNEESAPLPRAATEEYASWFKALADATRIQIVSLLALHRALGFRVVGTREGVGCQHGRWRDVLMIERRSAVTGLWAAGGHAGWLNHGSRWLTRHVMSFSQ
ncbi:hypothetical protein [Nonomuraea sp. NPDC050783]|uniref:hypothetical protein n=1 Tax=Nonomuraea sp. NPDC050783 TaxID=3154634 RepID=UPI0034668642